MFVFGSNNNTIGGPAGGNVISGNGSYGVTIESGSDGNGVADNYIGLDGGGNGGRGNSNGVAVFDSTNTTIGGLSGARRQRHREQHQLRDRHPRDRLERHGVVGNIIGLNPRGRRRPPTPAGSSSTARPACVLQQNVISGNTVDGVFINGGFSSVLRRNLIGTDVTGMTAFGNGGDGVDIVGAANITIGALEQLADERHRRPTPATASRSRAPGRPTTRSPAT